MPKISIIVAIYNVEQYLEKCINSLISQKYRNIEILLIDDGSTDSCSQMCDTFAEKDERIRAFHINNSGISAARNYGIEKAVGEYLMFVDGDDWVDPCYCSTPLMVAEREEADLVMFGHLREGKTVDSFSMPENRGPVPYLDRFRHFEEYHSAYVWNKLVKKELFDCVRFPEGYLYEDIPVSYKLLHVSENMWYVEDMLYHYRTRSGSVTWEKTQDKENDHYDTQMMAVSDMLSWGLVDEAERLKCRASFTYILRMDKRGKYSKECAKYFLSKECKRDELSSRAKLMVIAFFLCTPLFIAVSEHFGDRAHK